MKSSEVSRRARPGTFSAGVVRCPKCRADIHLFKVTLVGDEFSARCPKCGHRGFFAKREMTIGQFVDRRRNPRAT